MTCTVFQSSPAPRSGRYICRYGRDPETECFNPRPLRGAGATAAKVPPVHANKVSILARSEERALPAKPTATISVRWFQSSPAPRSGRYLRHMAFIVLARSFNPRPLRGAGATRCRIAAQAGLRVSILARSEERALLRFPARSAWCYCFNPRPLRGAGATRHDRGRRASQSVSILARSEERALRLVLRSFVHNSKFQSSPAPRSGRYRQTLATTRSIPCFNPRPLRGAGATRADAVGSGADKVSILARSEERALPSNCKMMIHHAFQQYLRELVHAIATST